MVAGYSRMELSGELHVNPGQPPIPMDIPSGVASLL